MAFNWQTFRTRTITAIIFAAVMLTGLLWNHWSFLVLFSVIHFGCWIEYQKIISLIDKEYTTITPFHRYAVMIAGWGFMLYMTNDAYMLGNFRLHEIGWWILLIMIFALPLTEIMLSRQLNLKVIGYSFAGLVYISLSWGLMIDLRSKGMMFTHSGFTLDFGSIIPMAIIASIWINDTMAYIVGSLIGKTPLSAISPKKTWEGTIGGAVLAVAVVSLTGYLLLELDFVLVAAVALIAAVMGTLGDLLESKLKRMAGVKDSGNIMPGHGGFLDRFDSMLLATPFVWLLIEVLT